jgi:D-alanyl-D-alanine carboxypeptidase (penicillin-binding protein 5/6)
MPRRSLTRKSLRLYLLCFSLVAFFGAAWVVYRNASGNVLGVALRQRVQAPPTFTFKVAPVPWTLSPREVIESSDIAASGMILVDEKTGHILAQRDADVRRPMASVTKIMTAALVLEFLNPDSSVTITDDALTQLPSDSALMGISPGEKYTVEELLYGMMLPSGNDAAKALAIAVAGSEVRFVAMMNSKVMQLGLQNTQFQNPSGLDAPDHYSSPRDLAVMAHYARAFPLFQKIVATPTISLPYTENHKWIDLVNYNSMVGMYPGATGIKPGNTGEAGNCLVASATRNGRDLIGVLLDTPGRNTNMVELFDRGFAAP